MEPEQEVRIANLRGSCVDAGFLQETHGITWPPEVRFERDFATSIFGSRGKPCESGKVDRYAFEMFLQSQRLLTRNYASARLGMRPDSLDALLPLLPKIGLSKQYSVYPGIIDESLSEDIVRSLRGLRFRTFGTHDSFCELLHAEIENALQLKITPLFCATADQLNEGRIYASTWDNITLLPLSTKHSVWLKFDKPLALAPDRCSKLFFAQHYDELRPYLAGREEPRDLSVYVNFARKSA